MTVSTRTISPIIKRLPKPLTDRLTREHVKAGNTLISIENSSEEILPTKVLHIVPPESSKQDSPHQFKNWNMPEMPDGYIKASHNELL